jgi:hypothetical protein
MRVMRHQLRIALRLKFGSRRKVRNDGLDHAKKSVNMEGVEYVARIVLIKNSYGLKNVKGSDLVRV